MKGGEDNVSNRCRSRLGKAKASATRVKSSSHEARAEWEEERIGQRCWAGGQQNGRASCEHLPNRQKQTRCGVSQPLNQQRRPLRWGHSSSSSVRLSAVTRGNHSSTRRGVQLRTYLRISSQSQPSSSLSGLRGPSPKVARQPRLGKHLPYPQQAPAGITASPAGTKMSRPRL